MWSQIKSISIIYKLDRFELLSIVIECNNIEEMLIIISFMISFTSFDCAINSWKQLDSNNNSNNNR
jgi:hypothetical protein